MKFKLIASSSTKEKLQEFINKYHYSDKWVICDDNTLFNPLFDKSKNSEINSHYRIKTTKGRWRFELRM